MWTISLMPASRAARLASLGISMPMISSADDTRRLRGRDARRDARDLAGFDRHVEDAVEPARDVHDPATLEDEIVHGCDSCEGEPSQGSPLPLREVAIIPKMTGASSRAICL